MQLPDEALWIGEKLPVPGVARPACGGVACFGYVPIHVDNTDSQWNFVVSKLIHQLQQLIGGISPETAPPIAQRPARQQTRFAAYFLMVDDCR